MNARLRRTTILCLLFLLLPALPAGAESREPLPAGAQVPDFELRDLDGNPHKLSASRGQKAIVLAQLSVDCPISRMYAPRLAALARDLRAKDVDLIGISSCRQDTLAELRALAKEHDIDFPILKDAGAQVADLLHAERATEVFLLDGELRLRYQGRIDDQFTITDRSVGFKKDRPETNDLADAVDAVLAGREVKTPRTQAAGCVIGREPKADPASKITFHEQVEPILQRRCQPCHRPGQIGPFPLISFQDAQGWEGMIAEVVEGGRMPPWHADPAYGKFSNDRSLSAQEKSVLLEWARGTAAEGDPAKAPPPASFVEGWGIGVPDRVYEMPRAFPVPAKGRVRYQYFQIPTNLEEDRWVEAVEVRAGNRSVVHHILVFAVDPKDPKAWEKETGGGTRGFFAAMVPGDTPVRYPAGTAKRLPAGTTLVLQVHYTTNGTETEDRSRIGLIFAKEPVTREVHTRTAVNMTLKIPPKTERQEVRAMHIFTRPLTLLSFLPHMHLRGSAYRYDLLHPARAKVSKAPWDAFLHERIFSRVRYDEREGVLTWMGSMDAEAYEALAGFYSDGEDRKAIDELRRDGKSETLLNVPAYDFGWQSMYVLAKPLTVAAGDALECTAVYNNSASNPALTRDMWEKQVKWGDQTWEEMMIGYFDCLEGAPEATKAGG